MNPAYPPLDLTFIRRHLAHSPVGQPVVYHTTIPSTMPIAAELAKDPRTPSGLAVIAEEQSSGRGRRGRTWHAPYASALLTSIILKPPLCHLPTATLTMLAGNALLAAVAATVPELAPDLHLKWPNDLVLGSDPATARKVAGILAESSLQADASGQSLATYAILGIGVNVNQQASDLPRIAPPTPRPTSLRVASHRLIDRGYLFVHLCQQLATGLAQSPAAIYQQWKTHLATLNQNVAVYANGVEQPATLIGRAIDVQEDGALVVQDTTGAQHTFHAADVSIRAA
jgi:BirA family biotin operon repressor/biotin-[acetyl-CoA-carboxylase] ligase